MLISISLCLMSTPLYLPPFNSSALTDALAAEEDEEEEEEAEEEEVMSTARITEVTFAGCALPG